MVGGMDDTQGIGYLTKSRDECVSSIKRWLEQQLAEIEAELDAAEAQRETAVTDSDVRLPT